MIDKDKQYKTRNGLPVRIYATDGEGPWSVHGAVLFSEGWKPRAWTKAGEADICGYRRIYDLIEVKPRIQRTEWFNVYRDRIGCGHKTKAEADADAGIGRKACLEITIDCEEGEGL